MDTLEARLGYAFRDRTLLENALTHSSYANENHTPGGSNERLEFLGDSILGMVTADWLYAQHPGEPEGLLTRTRAALVCEESLAEVADQLELGRYLRLGRGEANGGGRQRPSIRADAVEALLAAVYLDGGLEEARKIIRRFILNKESEKSASRDYKTALQELIQRRRGHTITYELVRESGPDHCRVFVMEVSVDGTAMGRGEGRSKKEAEQMAACAALEKLQ